jgi:hypothetical protein
MIGLRRAACMSGSRQLSVSACLVVGIWFSFFVPLAAQEEQTNTAIESGIQYLVSQQKPDGSIVDRGNASAMTSLAIMAMASVGHQVTDNSSESEALRRALGFILKPERQDSSGYFGANDGSRMYGHGIVTLMLTEMLGMGENEEMDKQIHDRCQKGIDLIVKSQKIRKNSSSRGGWRYTPTSEDSDLSVSVWQLMALRSAKNDGLDVPSETIEEAVAYLSRSFTSPIGLDKKPLERKSGFSYEPNQRNPTFTMTSAGLLAMQVCGDYDSEIVQGATEWLIEHPPKRDDRYLMYGLYYYSQAMHQRGGDAAKVAQERVRSFLLEGQNKNGSWTSPAGEEQSIGEVYSTAMAILSLSVNHHFLPIYQK